MLTKSEKSKDKRVTARSDISGLIFGSLTAQELNSKGPRKGGRLWLCKCSCGNEVLVIQKYLISGNTKSCGCLKAFTTAARNKAASKDHTGKTFGKWLVLERCEHRHGNGSLLWLCKCSCGATEEVTSINLVRGRSLRCTACKLALKHKQFCVNGHDTEVYGRDAYNYCKACVRDRSYKRNYGISLAEYEQLFEYQGGKCAICGVPLRNHIDPNTDNNKSGDLDHEHATKGKQAVRGLLCGGKWRGCNYNLGHVDDLEWLIKAVSYLKNPPAREMFKQVNGRAKKK